MTAALIDLPEIPARDRLREAQAALAAALAGAKAAADALARARETLGVLEGLRDAAQAEIVDEARDLAETFEQDGVVAFVGAAPQRRREIGDELNSFQLTYDIVAEKNARAQRAIGDAEAGVEAGVKAVIAQEVEPLLCRLYDCESAAALLRSELRALQFCGKFGLAPVSLPDRLRAEPVNVFRSDRPLTWDRQKSFDRQKAAWCDFADRLREDAGAMLSLGD